MFPIQTSTWIEIQRLITFISDLLDTKRNPSTHQITLIIYNPDNQSSQVATLIVSEDDGIYTFFNCRGEELDSESTSTASDKIGDEILYRLDAHFAHTIKLNLDCTISEPRFGTVRRI